MADALDIKILEKLDENIRIGSKQIAEKLGVRRQTVDYRIKRMESQGVILNYRMLGNLTKLGFVYHRAHFKLQSVTTEKKEEILNYLVKHKKTVWVVESDGRYDLLAGFIAKTLLEVRDTIFQFVTKFGSNIDYYDIVRPVEMVVPSRNFTDGQKFRSIKGEIVDQSEPEDIPEICKKIINELAANGRQTSSQIARKIKESPEKVVYHIKQIMKKKLLFSNIQFGYKFFGFELYKTLIYVKNTDRQRIEELKKFARSYPRIWDIMETLGKWQLELDIESKGHEDYYEIMDAIQDNFSDIINNYDTIFIRKERKILFTVFS